MAFNGSGTFTLTYTWATEAGSPPIAISKLDTQEQDIASGLSNCITKDGQTTVTANIPFNDKKITGLGNATADADALNRVTADARYALASTISSGTFTGTLTGCTTSPTGTCRYEKRGNVVTLFIPYITGTSNSTSFTLTGIPAGITPTRIQLFNGLCARDGGTNVGRGTSTVQIEVTTSSTLVFYLDGSVWTNSGAKSIGWSDFSSDGQSITYILT